MENARTGRGFEKVRQQLVAGGAMNLLSFSK